MTLHIHVVPTHVHSVRQDGDPRWCFVCRKHTAFTRTVHVPDDIRGYYGPHCTIECKSGHVDGDLFPGRWREWSEDYGDTSVA